MRGAIDKFVTEFEKYGMLCECPPMKQVMSEDELVELLPHYDGWIIGDDMTNSRVFEAGLAGKLTAVVKWGVGIDNIDFDAANQLGLKVPNTPGMFGEEVSDVAMGYLVGLARELFRIDRGVRAGNWPKPAGMSLTGKRVALAGFGSIGQACARKIAAFGMNITVYDPYAKRESVVDCDLLEWPRRLDEADFILITCALTDQNRHMLNAEVLSSCKRGVRVINVARGPLIDEAALVVALESGQVASAALDVYEDEPLSPASPLRKFEQCVFGSHNGSNTEEAVIRTSLKALELLNQNL